MNNDHQLNDYINSHPRECLFLLVIVICLIWQGMVAILALVIFYVYSRVLKIPLWSLCLVGIALVVNTAIIQNTHFAFTPFLKHGFVLNYQFLKMLYQQQSYDAFLFLIQNESIYIIGFTVFVAGLLGVIELIPTSPHKKTMKALQEGIYADNMQEISDKTLVKTINHLDDDEHDGTVLGVSKHTGKYLTIPDKDINQVMLVLGTTGGGKTITLRRFYQRALRKGYPLIIVDGKPDDGNIQYLQNLAEQNDRPFFGFNCANNRHYDPLAHGGFTELKDKIVCLKDEWSSDYYRSIAEDYLQTTFQVLLKAGSALDLNRVVECLVYTNLVTLVNVTQDEELMKRVARLKNYDMKDITGLQAHLDILIHSELGRFFEKDESTFSLADVINQNGVVYFALPALRFPSFSKVLGKLVINDIKAVVDRHNNGDKPIFTVFDEFSVFAGEQVLNLVNMGRGKGVHAIFGTQGLGDLDKVDASFKSQVLNCVNTLICHRLNDHESAEAVSIWIGTRESFTVTAQLSTQQGESGMGTVKRNKEFIVHPDEIKQGLKVGEVYYCSKVRGFEWGKVRVVYG